MPRTISGNQTQGISLALASDNPVTVAANASIVSTIGWALYGADGIKWDITNLGSISMAVGGGGIGLGGTGVVQNGDPTHPNASISTGSWGVMAHGSGSVVVNYGTITTTKDLESAIYLPNGGDITNHPSGVINGGVTEGSYGLVNNYGKIFGLVYMQQNFINNGSESDSSAVIENAAGSAVYGNGRVVNHGRISGSGPSGSGLSIQNGSVQNGSPTSKGATISGFVTGVSIATGSNGSVDNDGTIIGKGATDQDAIGVYIASGGFGNTLVNGSVAESQPSIVGGATGVSFQNGIGTVKNNGTIVGESKDGIAMQFGGTISNSATGRIEGATYGVNFGGNTYWTATIANDGMISGGTGVRMPGGGGTLVNGGTIVGTSGVAFQGGDGADSLAVMPGAGFVGTIDGGGGSNVLRLEAGEATGTMAGFGSKVLNFQVLEAAPGGTWQISGTAEGLLSGQTLRGFDLGDSITVAGLEVVVANATYDAGSKTTTVLLQGSKDAQMVLGGQYEAEALHARRNGSGGTVFSIGGDVAHYRMEGGPGGTVTYRIPVHVPWGGARQQTYEWAVQPASGPGLADASDFAGGELPHGVFYSSADSYTGTIKIDVAGDAVPEGVERFVVLFRGSPVATAYIADDDTTFSIAATDAFKPEGTGGTTSCTFTVTRTGTSGESQVDWAVTGAGSPWTGAANGGDFPGGAFPSGTVSFLHGEASKVIVVPLDADAKGEPNEGFAVTLSNPSPGATLGTATAQGIILNDDTSLSIAPLVLQRAEGSGASPDAATPFTFQVTRTGSLSAQTHFSLKVEGVAGIGTLPAGPDDFVGLDTFGQLRSFAAGEATQEISVPVRADKVAEFNERFRVTVISHSPGVNVSGAGAEGVILTDDTTFSVFADDARKPEGHAGTTAFTFRVQRSGDAAAEQKVSWSVAGIDGNGTVKAGPGDFAAGAALSGTITFAAGETSRILSIPVAGDRSAESNERFAVTLSSPTGGAAIGRGVAHGIILDDDIIRSTPANETLSGTAGADLFLLGGGLDTVLAGTGTDTFRFLPEALGPQGSNAVTLEDFSRAAGERLNLSAIDAIAGTLANDAFGFIGTAAFNGTPGQLRWQDQGGGTLLIQGNVNADTVADLSIFVKAPGPIDSTWFVL